MLLRLTLRRCFPALVSKQAVEGHRGRKREAMWVAIWSDIIFFSVVSLHMHSYVAHSMFVTSFALCRRYSTDRDCTYDTQSNCMLTYCCSLTEFTQKYILHEPAIKKNVCQLLAVEMS